MLKIDISNYSAHVCNTSIIHVCSNESVQQYIYSRQFSPSPADKFSPMRVGGEINRNFSPGENFRLYGNYTALQKFTSNSKAKCMCTSNLIACTCTYCIVCIFGKL